MNGNSKIERLIYWGCGKLPSTRKSKYSKKEDKAKLMFELPILDLFCSYILSRNKSIKKSNFIQMRNLFSLIDMEPYMNDQARLDRIKFINRGLEAIIDKRLTDQAAIAMYANGGYLGDSVNWDDFEDLPNPEIDYVNETVSKCLKNLSFNGLKDDIKDIIARYEATDYKDRDAVIADFEEKMNEIHQYFRRIKNDNSSSEYFCLQAEIMYREVEEAWNALANPASTLKTGMQGFNELLGGGLQLGRHYMLFGLPGEGKSTTMLNIAIQVKKHNPWYQTKDPTKRPCVVVHSQENSKKETIERFYNVSTSSGFFIDKDVDTVYHEMRETGRMKLTDESPIDIIIIFTEPLSNDTSKIEEIIDNLYDDGYEVILYTHDYVQKIHCQNKAALGDSRLELGSVVAEEVAIAKHRDIAFLTAGQLNRDASGKIDTARNTNKVDLVRMIGRSNIGESMLMLNHTDGAYVLTQEFNATEGRWYYGLQRIKKRFRATDRQYIYQPAYPDCKIRLVEDLNGEPCFKDSMAPIPQGQNIGPKTKVRTKQVDDDIRILDSSMNGQAAIDSIMQQRAAFQPMFYPAPFTINIPKSVPCPWSIKIK